MSFKRELVKELAEQHERNDELRAKYNDLVVRHSAATDALRSAEDHVSVLTADVAGKEIEITALLDGQATRDETIRVLRGALAQSEGRLSTAVEDASYLAKQLAEIHAFTDPADISSNLKGAQMYIGLVKAAEDVAGTGMPSGRPCRICGAEDDHQGVPHSLVDVTDVRV